jgi:transcriptional regulator with XRE-family HTH domain
MTALADLAHVPASTISRIESGKLEPTLAMVARITEAAGFRFEPELTESGSDQPFVDLLDRFENANADERERLFKRFPETATTAPLGRRSGMRRVAVPQSLERAIDLLIAQRQNPVVSGMEAVAESIDPMSSFIPIVYVEDPTQVTGFGPAGRGANQILMILPTTEGVRSYTRGTLVIPMVSREWGLLDALASPGRQSDIALDLFESMTMVTT